MLQFLKSAYVRLRGAVLEPVRLDLGLRVYCYIMVMRWKGDAMVGMAGAFEEKVNWWYVQSLFHWTVITELYNRSSKCQNPKYH